MLIVTSGGTEQRRRGDNNVKCPVCMASWSHMASLPSSVVSVLPQQLVYCVCISLCVYVYVCAYVYVCVSRVCPCPCLCVSMYVCTYSVCLYVCVCMCVCVFTLC